MDGCNLQPFPFTARYSYKRPNNIIFTGRKFKLYRDWNKDALKDNWKVIKRSALYLTNQAFQLGLLDLCS